MNRIQLARLTKLKHKEKVNDVRNFKKMECMFGKLNAIDEILNIDEWKTKQRILNQENDVPTFDSMREAVNEYSDIKPEANTKKEKENNSNILNLFKAWSNK